MQLIRDIRLLLSTELSDGLLDLDLSHWCCIILTSYLTKRCHNPDLGKSLEYVWQSRVNPLIALREKSNASGTASLFHKVKVEWRIHVGHFIEGEIMATLLQMTGSGPRLCVKSRETDTLGKVFHLIRLKNRRSGPHASAARPGGSPAMWVITLPSKFHRWLGIPHHPSALHGQTKSPSMHH